jgi:hypothetical protein
MIFGWSFSTVRRICVVLCLLIACIGGSQAVLAYHGVEGYHPSEVVFGSIGAFLGLLNAILWIVSKPHV